MNDDESLFQKYPLPFANKAEVARFFAEFAGDMWAAGFPVTPDPAIGGIQADRIGFNIDSVWDGANFGDARLVFDGNTVHVAVADNVFAEASVAAIAKALNISPDEVLGRLERIELKSGKAVAGGFLTETI